MVHNNYSAKNVRNDFIAKQSLSVQQAKTGDDLVQLSSTLRKSVDSPSTRAVSATLVRGISIGVGGEVSDASYYAQGWNTPTTKDEDERPQKLLLSGSLFPNGALWFSTEFRAAPSGGATLYFVSPLITVLFDNSLGSTTRSIKEVEVRSMVSLFAYTPSVNVPWRWTFEINNRSAAGSQPGSGENALVELTWPNGIYNQLCRTWGIYYEPQDTSATPQVVSMTQRFKFDANSSFNAMGAGTTLYAHFGVDTYGIPTSSSIRASFEVVLRMDTQVNQVSRSLVPADPIPVIGGGNPTDPPVIIAGPNGPVPVSGDPNPATVPVTIKNSTTDILNAVITDVNIADQTTPLWISDLKPEAILVAEEKISEILRIPDGDIDRSHLETLPASISGTLEAKLTVKKLRRILNNHRCELFNGTKTVKYLPILHQASILSMINVALEASSTGWSEMLQRLWNQLMHSLFGNTEIIGLSSASRVYDPHKGLFFDGIPCINKKSQVRRFKDHQTELEVEEATIDTRSRFIRSLTSLTPEVEETALIWMGEKDEWTLPRKLPRVSPPKPRNKGNATHVNSQSTADNRRGLSDGDRVSRDDQRNQVVERLLKKITSWDLALEWIMTCETKIDDDFLLLLMSEVRKRHPHEHQAKYCVEAHLNKRPIYQRLVGLSKFSSRVHKAVDNVPFRNFLAGEYPIFFDEINDDSDWADCLAARHNAVMHALNGNIPHHLSRKMRNKLQHALNGNTSNMEFPTSMSDIKAHRTTVDIYREKGSATDKPLSNPIEDVERQAGIKNIQGLNMSNVPIQMPIRGGHVNADNTYVPVGDLNHPESMLFPRTVRAGPGVGLVPSTNRLPLYGIGLVRRMNKYGLERSTHGAAVYDILTKSGNIRPNQITDYGFYTSEIAGLLRVEGDDNGDTIVAGLTKMLLYSLTASWDQAPSQLPLSGEAGKYDSFTFMANPPNVQTGYNDSVVFGENCGGAPNPIMPFTAEVPTVAFHVSNQTVPAGHTPIYVRASLLQQNDRGRESLNLALLSMFHGPYPVGLPTVRISTVDNTGGNPAVQLYIPFSACVHMPGASTIDIILPVVGPNNPATSVAAANANAVVRPSTGPTPYGGLPGDAFLNINYIGGAYQAYDLSDYLGTWLAQPATPIDVTTIARFIKQIAELLQRGKDLRFAYEVASLMSVRYPILHSTTPGVNIFYSANSLASVQMQNFMALLPRTMTASVPTNEQSYDFYLPELNLMFWNKVMVGAYTAKPDTATYPLKNYLLDGSPRSAQYAIYLARRYAITSEYLFQYMGQSAATWDDAFQQTTMVKIADTMRKYFVSAQTNSKTSDILKSEAGHVLAFLHFKVNGCAPAHDMYGYSIWSYINAPRIGFQTAWSTIGPLSDTLPCILPDIWVQLFSSTRSLAFAPFIPPLKKMTGLQDPGYQVTALAAGVYSVPGRPEDFAREVSIGNIPFCDDKSVWNKRLVWHGFGCRMFTLDGNLYNGLVPGVNEIIVQKFVQSDYTFSNNQVSTILGAKTNWFPNNDSTGLRLTIATLTAADSNLMSQIMDTRAFASTKCWVFNNIQVQPSTIIGTQETVDDGNWSDIVSENASSTPSPSLGVDGPK